MYRSGGEGFWAGGKGLRSAWLLMVFGVLVSAPVSAQQFFEAPLTFRVARACGSGTSLRAADGPGVSAGMALRALGQNRAEAPSHVLVDLQGQRRWVAMDCGRLEGAAVASVVSAPVAARGRAADCAPFFDTDNNPVALQGGRGDITPPPQPQDAFDEAVARFCGAPGSKTRRNGFEQLLRAHPRVLADVMAFTGGQVYAGRRPHTDAQTYLEDLSRAWYEEQGFDHIFCGELQGGKIGGLHWQGRYQQLQQQGGACRIERPGRGEVRPGATYSMGVRMQGPDGRWFSSDIKGYGLTLSAADLLKAATRAFVDNPASGRETAACLLTLKDGAAAYDMVFVGRKAGIRTFYPDATPDRRRNGACAQALRLD